MTIKINDPYFSLQWFLNDTPFSIKAQNVWDKYTGRGVKVGVLDDGFDYTHPDFTNSYRTDLDYDFVDKDYDAKDRLSTDRHGTAVMSIIGADANNGIGFAGVAHGADLIGYRMGFGTGSLTQIAQAMNLAANNVDILNSSWGFTTALSDNFFNPAFRGIENAMINLAENGRDGLGTIQVFAAGNGREEGSSPNYHNLSNSPFAIAVGGIDYDGTYSYFSEAGANILISAPATYVPSADKTGSGGYSTADYIYFGGTSAAAPIVSGVIALMLEANPNLGYRDIQAILAYSATHNDASSNGWQTNGARNFNGGGLQFNHDYGYGVVNAQRAVALAETWQTTPKTFANLDVLSYSGTANETLLDNRTIRKTFTVLENFDIEHVQLSLDIEHRKAGDLQIALISSDGTKSILADRIENGNYTGDILFTFSSVAHYGENTAGQWTIEITDPTHNDQIGYFYQWEIQFLGTRNQSDDMYIYTDDFANLSQSALNDRALLDLDGGVDTINLAAVTIASTVDLTRGYVLINSASAEIENSTLFIENIIGGSNGDTLIGNNLNNNINGRAGNDWLYGWGGNDDLYGGSGDDTIRGNAGNDNLYGGTGNDRLRGDQGNDTLYGDIGNDVLQGDLGNDRLNGGTGSDRLTGGLGSDIFAFGRDGYLERTFDRIMDFKTSEGDKIDISDILDGAFNALDHAIADFVRVTQTTAHSLLQVDADGASGTQYGFQTVARFENTLGLDQDLLRFIETAKNT
jgi:subtilisin family serine protease